MQWPHTYTNRKYFYIQNSVFCNALESYMDIPLMAPWDLHNEPIDNILPIRIWTVNV